MVSMLKGKNKMERTDGKIAKDPDMYRPTHSEMVKGLKKDGNHVLEDLSPFKADMIHMVMGISGEAGELLDAVKKCVIYKKNLDLDNVIEELGDIEFYLEGLRQILQVTRAETLNANIDKLGTRYKNFQYTNKQATERADKR